MKLNATVRLMCIVPLNRVRVSDAVFIDIHKEVANDTEEM
jgi:hypothetical protein